MPNPQTPPKSDGPITVSDLTRDIKLKLETTFDQVDVTGELGRISLPASGHAYLTLKDADARIDCVIYSSTLRFLRYQPGEGTQVRAQGRVSVYPPRGGYQLVIDHLEPAGVGQLQALYEALKATLLSEGLFDVSRKRPLPFLPRKVGVITSGSGAARRDIEAVVHRRSPQIPIVLYPSRVEGAGAAPSLVEGLKVLAARDDIDVIIIGRGGGSMESLWAFNTEIVARAIAACPIPVISAVGHETDTTIADLVADLRAPTPSAAAERAVPERAVLLSTLDTLRRRAALSLTRLHERAATRHERLVTRLNTAIDLRIQAQARTLQKAQSRLGANAPSARLTRARARLTRLIGRLEAPSIPARQARIESLEAALTHAAERRLARAQRQFSTAVAQLDALSPLAVLARGYSIVQRPDGAVIRTASNAAVGDALSIQLHRGQLTAIVTATAPAAKPDPEESHV
ncbi:MAG: exodeoxyribonuclease VII large subunit [Bradymonadia bacterium]|jgi:exodeoxyribonuclease VII large subunit